MDKKQEERAKEAAADTDLVADSRRLASKIDGLLAEIKTAQGERSTQSPSAVPTPPARSDEMLPVVRPARRALRQA
jgi:hypothetical protein